MWLSMNTNAGAKDIYWWAKLAEVIGRKGAVISSVDGLRDTTHHTDKMLYGKMWKEICRHLLMLEVEHVGTF